MTADSSTSLFFPYILAGELTRDFIIPQGGKPLSNVPGGSLIYSAAGLSLWHEPAGLLARIGVDYPEEWVEKLTAFGMDVRGVRRMPLPMEQRRFLCYATDEPRMNQYPLADYSRLGLPFPRELLGYRIPAVKTDSQTERKDQSIIARDIPSDYLYSSYIHISAIDYMTHNLLPAIFRSQGEKIITLQLGESTMSPDLLRVFPTLLNRICAIISTETCVRRLFSAKRISDLWEMAKRLSDFGVEYVVIRTQDKRMICWDSRFCQSWVLTDYDAKIINPTGMSDAFCGGFLAGLRRSGKPSDALVYGNTAASIIGQGPSPFYALEVLPELVLARMEILQAKLEML